MEARRSVEWNFSGPMLTKVYPVATLTSGECESHSIKIAIILLHIGNGRRLLSTAMAEARKEGVNRFFLWATSARKRI